MLLRADPDVSAATRADDPARLRRIGSQRAPTSSRVAAAGKRRGNTIVVTKLDRLAGSVRHLTNLIG